MGRQQQLHNTQPLLISYGGKHVSILGNTFARLGRTGHISMLLEIWIHGKFQPWLIIAGMIDQSLRIELLGRIGKEVISGRCQWTIAHCQRPRPIANCSAGTAH
jgi:hypothetical protein